MMGKENDHGSSIRCPNGQPCQVKVIMVTKRRKRRNKHIGYQNINTGIRKVGAMHFILAQHTAKNKKKTIAQSEKMAALRKRESCAGRQPCAHVKCGQGHDS